MPEVMADTGGIAVGGTVGDMDGDMDDALAGTVSVTTSVCKGAGNRVLMVNTSLASYLEATVTIVSPACGAKTDSASSGVLFSFDK